VLIDNLLDFLFFSDFMAFAGAEECAVRADSPLTARQADELVELIMLWADSKDLLQLLILFLL
jgi:hypothetical protein